MSGRDGALAFVSETLYVIFKNIFYFAIHVESTTSPSYPISFRFDIKMISESYPKLGEQNRVEMGQQILQNPVSGTMPHAPGMPHTPGINYVNGMGYLDLGTGTVTFKIQ